VIRKTPHGVCWFLIQQAANAQVLAHKYNSLYKKKWDTGAKLSVFHPLYGISRVIYLKINA